MLYVASHSPRLQDVEQDLKLLTAANAAVVQALRGDVQARHEALEPELTQASRDEKRNLRPL